MLRQQSPSDQSSALAVASNDTQSVVSHYADNTRSTRTTCIVGLGVAAGILGVLPKLGLPTLHDRSFRLGYNQAYGAYVALYCVPAYAGLIYREYYPPADDVHARRPCSGPEHVYGAVNTVIGYRIISSFRNAEFIRKLRYPTGPALSGRLVPVLAGGIGLEFIRYRFFQASYTAYTGPFVPLDYMIDALAGQIKNGLERF